MRLLTDENISPVIVAALEAAGHDVLAVAKEMPSAPDPAIMERAIVEQRILITEDKDFGELAFKHGHRPVGIIRLVLPGYWPSQKAERLCEVLVAPANIIDHAAVVEPDRVRSRAIPKP
ncbi:MAG: DUF5615 family PIN-like protein [Alphaproteobacteria bacterium]|nr:DUF5615 family PIN-like protein [Alphaproteobacteria bacterium]